MQNKNVKVNHYLNTQLITHLNNLQDRYSKILPIRIDIHYAKDDECNTDIQTAKQEMTYFVFQAMKFELDIVGYAVVMEYSQNEHIHFHAVFYVNGQKRQKYYPIYSALVYAWHNLTKGYLYDCQRNDYKVNGLLMLNHHDEEAYRSVCYMLSYLAKTEQKAPFKSRYNDCLFLSEVAAPSNSERPRTKGLYKFLYPLPI